MLLIEQLKSTAFSNSEQLLVDYLIAHPEQLDTLTASALAKMTHTNPTSLVRVAKKLGFNGWRDLKQAYLKEWQYLNSHYNTIDANLPFDKSDNVLAIANKLATLEQNTIQDTVSLLQYPELKKAQNLLLQAKEILIFGSHTNAMIAQEFVTKMRRINRKVAVASTYHYQEYEAFYATPDVCAIIISYTGEHETMRKCTDLLKQNGVPIISLTSVGDNTIAQQSDCNLRISTREKLYSKIGNFTSNTSIIYLLNLLYATIFAADYDHNLDQIVAIGQAFDRRETSVDLMKE
jgi:DNA-binding MurR/RpiR family transcriptional regulator